MNNRDMSKKSGIKMMADGGNVGFFERLSMGNIDQEGSRAYNELGAGRDKGIAASDAKFTPAPMEAPAQADTDTGYGAMELAKMERAKGRAMEANAGMDEKDARDDAIGSLPSIARVSDSMKTAAASKPKARPAAVANTSAPAGIVNGINAMESARMDRAKSRATETATVLAKKPAPKSMVTDVGLPSSPVIAPGKRYFNDNGSVKMDAPEPPMRNAKTGKPYANGGMITYANGGMVCNSRDMGK